MTPLTDRLQADIERQLYGSVVFLIRVSQLVCSAPLGFSLESLRAPAGIRPKLRQRLAQLVHYLWSITYLMLLLVCMFYQHLLADVNKDTVEQFLYTCSYIASGINSSIVLIGTGRQRAAYARTFERIVRIDRQFADLLADDATDRLHYAQIGRDVRRDLFVFAVLMVSSLSVDFYSNHNDWLTFGRSVIVYIVPNCTVCTCLMQYVFGLRVLRARYALLNGLLVASLRTDAGSRLVHRTSDVRMVRAAGSGRTVDHDRLERRLSTLRRLHFQLAQLNASLTEGFGALLIGNLVAVCVVLTIVFFTFYLIASNSERYLSVSLSYGLYTVLWMLLYLCRVVLILCHSELVNGRRGGVVEPLYRIECEQRGQGATSVYQAVGICEMSGMDYGKTYFMFYDL